MKSACIALLLAALAPAAQGKEKPTLWKEWYLYSSAGVPQGYFEEEAEHRPKDKQVAISQRWVENEDGGTTTFIGAVAKDDAKLTPIAFFSERKGQMRTYKLDGRTKGASLEMTFKPVIPPGANLKQSVKLRKDMVLSLFLPLKIARAKAGHGPVPFTAVVEDAKDGNFDSRPGSFEVQGATKNFKGLTCRRTVVSFNGSEDEWWLTKEGKICEIFVRANQSKLTLSSEAEAKAALEKP